MAKLTEIEGTWEELSAHAEEFKGRWLKLIVFSNEEETEEAAESLEAAMARMTNRTPEEIASTRERILSATPSPRELPQGKTLLDVVMGQWPGDETDEEINTALEKLS